jgi:hypothetical protein
MLLRSNLRRHQGNRGHRLVPVAAKRFVVVKCFTHLPAVASVKSSPFAPIEIEARMSYGWSLLHVVPGDR